MSPYAKNNERQLATVLPKQLHDELNKCAEELPYGKKDIVGAALAEFFAKSPAKRLMALNAYAAEYLVSDAVKKIISASKSKK